MKTEPNDLMHSFNHIENSEGNFAGLTKREYFAGLAMQGLVSGNLATTKISVHATDAVNMADALISALNAS